MIKAVLFDMDGLMFDTEQLNMEAWYTAGAEFGVDFPKDLILKSCGRVSRDTKVLFGEYFGPSFHYESCRALQQKHMMELVHNGRLKGKPGLRRLLSFLREQGLKTAVATSSSSARAEEYLRIYGITAFFDAIVGGDMIERGKPDPEIYLKAAEAVGVKPENCLVLEDAPPGLLAASRAGMTPVMIPDLLPPDEHTRAISFRVLPSLAEVPPLILELNGSK